MPSLTHTRAHTHAHTHILDRTGELARWVVALDSEENERVMRTHGDRVVSGAIAAAPPRSDTKVLKERAADSRQNRNARM